MRPGAALMFVLALPSCVVSGQAEEWERFELYAECRPVVSVTSASVSLALAPDGTIRANNRDAMEDAIQAAGEASVESRLRAAGLWWSWSENSLFENVFLQATVTVDPTFAPSGLTLYLTKYDLSCTSN